MTQVVAFAMVSLDGFVNDKNGDIDWHMPDDETHAFANELQSRSSDQIYDEANYHIMKWWENPPGLASMPPVIQQYAALWQQSHKTIISTRLSGLDPAQYSVWPEFNPQAVARLRERASRDIAIAGTALMAQALRLQLLDRIDLLTVPILLGAGEPCFQDVPRTGLKLLETRTFGSGWVYSAYGTR